MSNNSFQNQWAVTMVEMMLSLAVAAAIFIASTMYYSSARDAAYVNEVVKNMGILYKGAFEFISQNTDNTVHAQLGRGDVGIQKLIDEGLIPDTFLKLQNHFWDAKFQVFWTHSNGGDVSVIFGNHIPLAACNEIKAKLAQAGVRRTAGCASAGYRSSVTALFITDRDM